MYPTDDSLSKKLQQQDDGDDAPRRAARRLLPCVAGVLVAGHFATCAYRAAGNPSDLAFVAAAYTILGLLLYCVGSFEALAADASPDAAAARERMRPPVWALSAALTALFTSRVAPMMPPPLDAVVVGMAVAVTVGGFCLLFMGNAGEEEDDDDDDEADSDQDIEKV
uniref:Uncharacterized protein n=1 Tax=Leersia perrieri TaxID=77586 RepID=A0A0D9UXL9_9ORYZ